MATYLDVNLADVDLSFKLPPVGDYIAKIDGYEIRPTQDNKGVRDVKFDFLLIEGNPEGVGMKVNEFPDPKSDMGQKRLRMMADAVTVPYDRQHIDLDLFLGRLIQLSIIHKPGKNADAMFANIKTFGPPPKPGD